jgi:hypothetical protein
MNFPAMTVLACFGIVLVLDVLHWLFQIRMPAEVTENNGNVAVIKFRNGETVEIIRKDRNETVPQFMTKFAVGTVFPARVTLRRKHTTNFPI